MNAPAVMHPPSELVSDAPVKKVTYAKSSEQDRFRITNSFLLSRFRKDDLSILLKKKETAVLM